MEGADIADAKWMAIEAAFGTTSSHENMLRKLGFAYAAPVIQFNMNIPGLLKALSASERTVFSAGKTDPPADRGYGHQRNTHCRQIRTAPDHNLACG